VTIDLLFALAPSNLECSKADAFFHGALVIASVFFVFATNVVIRVDWSIVKLQNFRIALTEDEWNTEIIGSIV
jgi:hypothetical protein